ncbi:MAG: SdiA-regulated domain-containing protein [bacterium]|nr:SdiA-regulated domain-containing protein [bacterium]
MLNLFRVLVLIVLVTVISFAITSPVEDSLAALYSAGGKRFPARKIVAFPLILETSSLAYDDSSGTFYTTADKGKPHIMQFRVKGKEVEIIRADTIKGIKRNYDWEGIELIAPPKGPRFLQLSTERFRQKDAIVNPAVSLDSFTNLPDQAFVVKAEGIGQNNNFESVTYLPPFELFLFGKERQPIGLYGARNGQPAFKIFGQTEFQFAHDRFIDSALGSNYAVDRISVLKGIAFSGMAYDNQTGNLLILNRFGRSVISVRLTEGSTFGWQIVDVWPYDGIDDESDESLEPGSLIYGVGEGLAVYGTGEERTLAIITDPGKDNRPTLYLFPYPR